MKIMYQVFCFIDGKKYFVSEHASRESAGHAMSQAARCEGVSCAAIGVREVEEEKPKLDKSKLIKM